jgi:hypothetical protein
MEQYVRDARINMIYEGTNGIQALDLLGRKVLGNQGASLQKFGKLIGKLVAQEMGNEAMAEFIQAIGRLEPEDDAVHHRNWHESHGQCR